MKVEQGSNVPRPLSREQLVELWRDTEIFGPQYVMMVGHAELRSMLLEIWEVRYGKELARKKRQKVTREAR